MLDIWLPNRSLEEAMQRSNHQDAKWQLLWCKVTSFGVQSYKHQDAIPNFFDFNLKYLLSINGGFLIGNIYASHQIALRSSPNSSPLKTAYLYSLSVYLCSFGLFLPPHLLKFLPISKTFLTFCLFKIQVLHFVIFLLIHHSSTHLLQKKEGKSYPQYTVDNLWKSIL